jgi:signal transduction histidine kinase
MSQQNSTVRPNSKSVPGTGMRGGLGRTLLTAFLVLSIVPLGVIGFVAATQARHNLQRELEEKLVTIATLTESQIRDWVTSQRLILTILSKGLPTEFQAGDVASGERDTSSLGVTSSSPGERIQPPSGPSSGIQSGNPGSVAAIPPPAYAQDVAQFSHFRDEIAEIQSNNPASLAWLLLDQDGNVLAAQPSILESHAFPSLLRHQQVLLEAGDLPALWEAIASQADRSLDIRKSPSFVYAQDAAQSAPAGLLLTQPVPHNNWTLAALLDPRNLIQTIDANISWTKTGAIYLVPPSGRILQLSLATTNCMSVFFDGAQDSTCTDASQGIDVDYLAEPLASSERSDASPAHATEGYRAALEMALSGTAGITSYQNHLGVAVIGAYRWLPELQMALLVEQPRDSALASSDNLAVVLIGATLGVVLLTALIAAAVARRITLPIVQLTATAVQIAAGDLNQKVPATRRDEIGILARAFNVMTVKLRVLYEDLEQKVRERTQQLRDANAEIRYRAMQLAISAEVGRVVTSILDRDLLLSQVVELIRDCFQAYFVAIYFIDESGQWAIFQEGSGGLGVRLKAEDHRIDLGQDGLVSRAINTLEPQVVVGSALDTLSNRQMFPFTQAELAVPLKIGDRIIGVLDVHSVHKDAFAGDEIMVLETLSGQIVVAIENARAYKVERQAAQQLRELETLRRHFLSNMSRELRMPLNNIIGFSRVILKGIDGPITDLQREDLNAIHESGQQLLVLINDILDIAQIEAGAMELAVRPVDFGELAHSVIPTANALVQGRPIEFHYQIDDNLPPVLADPYRLRQVLVKLLSNAAKFTPKGKIALHVWCDNDEIMASVIDTGIGIPDKDRDKLFEMFRQLSQPVESTARGTGLGLTFSKEIVEMHGGKIWFESKEGKGSAFTISLPVLESKDGNQ